MPAADVSSPTPTRPRSARGGRTPSRIARARPHQRPSAAQRLRGMWRKKRVVERLPCNWRSSGGRLPSKYGLRRGRLRTDRRTAWSKTAAYRLICAENGTWKPYCRAGGSPSPAADAPEEQSTISNRRFFQRPARERGVPDLASRSTRRRWRCGESGLVSGQAGAPFATKSGSAFGPPGPPMPSVRWLEMATGSCAAVAVGAVDLRHIGPAHDAPGCRTKARGSAPARLVRSGISQPSCIGTGWARPGPRRFAARRVAPRPSGVAGHGRCMLPWPAWAI